MERKDNSTNYLFITGVVAIVAVVALVLSNGSGVLEGAPVYQVKTDNFQDSCTDNDPDNDFYKLGKVNFGRTEYLDYCLGDSHVIQHYCASTNSVKPTTAYECPNGCKNGFCLREPIS